jgi:hypothetical protein
MVSNTALLFSISLLLYLTDGEFADSFVSPVSRRRAADQDVNSLGAFCETA